jgi:2-aminoadipate transaminase
MKKAEIKRALETKKNIKKIYVIPNFQNPTGKSWSLERRKELIKLSKSYDIPIVEDNAYEEICFMKEKRPSLKSLDTEGKVIYLGSFSKTFCPGLRVGWIQAKNSILEKYIIIKQSSDMHTNILAQMQINKYLELNDFDAHISKINLSYKNRRDKMIKAMKEHFPSSCSYTYPEGGMFIWVEMPEKLNARKVLNEALKENVIFIPGDSFYPNKEIKNTFRLNFSNTDESKISIGIERLAKVLKRFIYDDQ